MFETIQGEGVFTGVPSVFIRLQECAVGCSWCDTKHTQDATPQDERPLNEILTKTRTRLHGAVLPVLTLSINIINWVTKLNALS